MSERGEKRHWRNEQKSDQELLDMGHGVAAHMEQLYPQLPDLMGSSLVESNVVLTLAGHKGKTEFFLDVPDVDDDEKIQKAMVVLGVYFQSNDPEARFEIAGDPFPAASDKIRTQMIGVSNLRGYARISRITKMPGVHPYAPESGFGGLREWIKETKAGLKEAQAQGLIAKGVDTESIYYGIARGYPDQALYDFSDWLVKKRKTKIVGTNIPFSKIYRAAQPNYDLYPEHTGDATIQADIKQAGLILQGFYESEWHKHIAQDPVFLQARQKQGDAKKR